MGIRKIKGIICFFFLFLMLSSEAQVRLEVRMPEGHSVRMNKFYDYSNDGKQIVSSDPNTIIVWDKRTGCNVKTLTNFRGIYFPGSGRTGIGCIRAQFSKGGKYIIGVFANSGEFYKQQLFIVIWDRSTYDIVNTYSLFMNSDYSLSNDDKYISFTKLSPYPELNICNLVTGKLVTKISFSKQVSNPTIENPTIIPSRHLSMSSDFRWLLLSQNEIHVKEDKVVTIKRVGIYDCQLTALDSGRLTKKPLQTFFPIISGNEEIDFHAGTFASKSNKVAVLATRRGTDIIYIIDRDNVLRRDSFPVGINVEKIGFLNSDRYLVAYSKTENAVEVFDLEKKKSDFAKFSDDVSFPENTFSDPYMLGTAGKNDSILFRINFARSTPDEFVVKRKSYPPLDAYLSEDGESLVSIHSIDIYSSYYTETMLNDITSKLSKMDWRIPREFEKSDSNYFATVYKDIWKYYKARYSQGVTNLRYWDLRSGEVLSYIPEKFHTKFDLRTKSKERWLNLRITERQDANSMIAKDVFNMKEKTRDSISTSALLREYMSDEFLSKLSPKKKDTVRLTKEKLYEAVNYFFLLGRMSDYAGLRSKYYYPDGEIISRSGKDTVRFYAIDSVDWILTDKKGYFYSSRNANKKLFFVKGNDVFSFEQLDFKYNRPDLILQSLGSKDTSLINAYKRAFEKRITRLGIDPGLFDSEFSVPESEILNAGEFREELQTPTISLKLKAVDTSQYLDRYNIWINDVPIYGQKGKSLSGKKLHEFNEEVTGIRLNPGLNRIEFSVFNGSGFESYRKPLILQYKPPVAEKENVYFIGIGINEFASGTNSLKWCVNDIQELANKLSIKYGQRLVTIDTLFNANVTPENIKKLKDRLYLTGVNDKVIISFSGHGLVSKKYDYFLSGYNTDFSNPERGGIPYEDIEYLLDSIPARKKLLLLDACNSGELDKSNGLPGKVGESAKQGSEKGGIVKNTGGTANKNSYQLMRQLFLNLNKGTGSYIIAAAQDYQAALENSQLGHGIFTYCILKAIENGTSLNVAQFQEIVRQQVVKLSSGKQEPTTRTETGNYNWKLW